MLYFGIGVYMNAQDRDFGATFSVFATLFTVFRRYRFREGVEALIVLLLNLRLL